MAKGETFCVACGFHNVGLSIDKQLAAGRELSERGTLKGWFRKVLRMFGIGD